MTQQAAPERAVRGTGTTLALVAVVLLAVGLRGPVASVGPLIDEVRAARGLHGVGASLLPALPLLCFGLLAPVAPGLAARLGLHRAVAVGSLALVAGVALRSAGVVGLFAGTVLVGAGIAVMNVLLPAVVKADFPHRLALATALVTSSIAVSASAGAGFAEPLRVATGGPLQSLAVWLPVVAVGLLAWLPLTRASAGPRVPGASRVLPLLRDRVALSVTLFLGLQSLVFYTLLAWLPSVLRDADVPAARAGLMLAVAAAIGAPVAFLVPRWAVRTTDQRLAVVVISGTTGLGLLGLLLAPGSAPWLWTVLVGLGTGGAFPLALTLVLLRTRDGGQAARLSACAQGVGYVLASTGPFAAGVLRDAAGGWRPSLVLLLVVLAVQIGFGLSAGRPRTVEG